MKYLISALILILIALLPYICGGLSVKAAEGRFRSACERIGINERPFVVEKGYLSSSLSLNEPLSTTVSSLGLPKEAVDFFRDKELVLTCDIAHGPMHFYKGAEHTVMTVRGPEWKITGEEWRTNRFDGAAERCAVIYDCALEQEGALFAVSNFWLRESKSAKELGAAALVVWPGAAVSDLRYSEKKEEEGRSGLLTVSLARFGEETLEGLSATVAKAPGFAPWEVEITAGTWNGSDLKGRKLEIEDQNKYNEIFSDIILSGDWLKELLHEETRQ